MSQAVKKILDQLAIDIQYRPDDFIISDREIKDTGGTSSMRAETRIPIYYDRDGVTQPGKVAFNFMERRRLQRIKDTHIIAVVLNSAAGRTEELAKDVLRGKDAEQAADKFD